MTDSIHSRRILIADFDLFHKVGGGQTVYHRLIALRPRDKFYYFLRRESATAARPVNAVGIPFVAEYNAIGDDIQIERRRLLWAYCEARNMAASIVRHTGAIDFDVVDVPDYTQHGIFIRAALEAEAMHCGTLALALHGTLSAAWKGGWPSSNDANEKVDYLRKQERLQFLAADARYAISTAYARQWQKVAPLAVNAIDPLAIIGTIDPVPAQRRSGAPDLAFIGRREKWKGPDLFLDMAWCVDPTLYNRLMVVGPDGQNQAGIGSSSFLEGIARLRGLKPEILGSQPHEQIRKIIGDRTVILLPSRHDTFNLVALEALVGGCPALVSDQAGISTWIQEKLPALDWLVVGVDCGRSAASSVSDVLRHYDTRRDAVIEAMRRLPTFGNDPFGGIYRASDAFDIDARQTVVELSAHFTTMSQLTTKSALVRSIEHGVAPIRTVAKGIVRAMPAPIHRLTRRIGALNQLRRGGAALGCERTNQTHHSRIYGIFTQDICANRALPCLGGTPAHDSSAARSRHRRAEA